MVAGHRFCVEPGVLIPRPETQRICDFVRTWSVEHWTTIAEEEKQAQPGTLNIVGGPGAGTNVTPGMGFGGAY